MSDCGSDHNLALWVTPEAIREAYEGDEYDPTAGLSDATLREIGFEVLDRIYDEYRTILAGLLEDE